MRTGATIGALRVRMGMHIGEAAGAGRRIRVFADAGARAARHRRGPRRADPSVGGDGGRRAHALARRARRCATSARSGCAAWPTRRPSASWSPRIFPPTFRRSRSRTQAPRPGAPRRARARQARRARRRARAAEAALGAGAAGARASGAGLRRAGRRQDAARARAASRTRRRAARRSCAAAATSTRRRRPTCRSSRRSANGCAGRAPTQLRAALGATGAGDRQVRAGDRGEARARSRPTRRCRPARSGMRLFDNVGALPAVARCGARPAGLHRRHPLGGPGDAVAAALLLRHCGATRARSSRRTARSSSTARIRSRRRSSMEPRAARDARCARPPVPRGHQRAARDAVRPGRRCPRSSRRRCTARPRAIRSSSRRW